MTQPLAEGDDVQVRVWCSNAEQASVNTFWYDVTAIAGTGQTDTQMANEIDTGFLSTLMPGILSNLSEYNGVQVQIHRGFTLFAAQFATAGAGVGTAGAVSLPRQTAGITHWSTIFAGRAFRGRSYWPFPSASDDTGDGVPTSGYVARLVTISNGLLNFSTVGTGGNTASVALQLMHRKNKAGVTPPPSLITGNSVEAFWATQRRRGSFGRPNVIPKL